MTASCMPQWSKQGTEKLISIVCLRPTIFFPSTLSHHDLPPFPSTPGRLEQLTWLHRLRWEMLFCARVLLTS